MIDVDNIPDAILIPSNTTVRVVIYCTVHWCVTKPNSIHNVQRAFTERMLYKRWLLPKRTSQVKGLPAE